ncbi:serine protease [Chytridiales sp. JEL 0842]|nr:serine protease [Chytridiales sp. JEL 0842]
METITGAVVVVVRGGGLKGVLVVVNAPTPVLTGVVDLKDDVLILDVVTRAVLLVEVVGGASSVGDSVLLVVDMLTVSEGPVVRNVVPDCISVGIARDVTVGEDGVNGSISAENEREGDGSVDNDSMVAEIVMVGDCSMLAAESRRQHDLGGETEGNDSVLDGLTDGDLRLVTTALGKSIILGSESRDGDEQFCIQRNSTWGLARISHRERPIDDEAKTFRYPRKAGEGVTIYTIDTGVNIYHEEFEGRATWGKTIPEDEEDIDGNGHGTHVAGTIVGKRFGVAKHAHIIAVKALRSTGLGSMSDVIKAVDWIMEDRLRLYHSFQNETAGPVVVNMSIGGPLSKALNLAIAAAIHNGLHFSVAAGNDNTDACAFSPASAPGVVSVGATTDEDRMAFFSNFGKCTDIYGPGYMIESAWKGNNTSTKILSGTSMAAPHVTGIMATFLSNSKWRTAPPANLKELLIQVSTKDLVVELPEWSESPNRLAFLEMVI